MRDARRWRAFPGRGGRGSPRPGCQCGVSRPDGACSGRCRDRRSSRTPRGGPGCRQAGESQRPEAQLQNIAPVGAQVRGVALGCRILAVAAHTSSMPTAAREHPAERQGTHATEVSTGTNIPSGIEANTGSCRCDCRKRQHEVWLQSRFETEVTDASGHTRADAASNCACRRRDPSTSSG